MKFLKRFMLWGPLVLFMGTGAVTFALPYGSGTYGTCTYNTCDITLMTSGTVNLPVTPTSNGVNTTAKDEAIVSTGASTGYTLTFLGSDTSTDLVSGANTISASGNTPASPSTLAINTWGYRVDGIEGFGAGPTSAQTNDPNAVFTFAGVPASNQTPHTLKITSSAASPSDTTDIWYGVRLDMTQPAGTYTGTVIYTAVTND